MKFEEIAAINVNEHTEKKNGLTYLSWAWAWAEFCKIHPDATYKVYKDESGLPYVFDPNTGFMCYVEVTADGITHEMWLPVMDSANNAMKAEPYVKKTKYKEFTVDAATMFDINKTIMRCLVKCLAMFGLGIYIYAGEDLPEVEKPSEEDRQKLVAQANDLIGAMSLNADKVCKKIKAESIESLPYERLKGMIPWLTDLDETKRKELM